MIGLKDDAEAQARQRLRKALGAVFTDDAAGRRWLGQELGRGGEVFVATLTPAEVLRAEKRLKERRPVL